MSETLLPNKQYPSDWSICRVDEVAHVTTGSRNTQDRADDGLYPFFVRSQSVERINSWSYDGEAVLTAGDGVGTGKVFHYIKGKFDCHQRVYRIADFDEGMDGFFFFKQFSHNFYDRIMSMTAKSSVDSVRREMIAGMEMPAPPIDEQISIAQALRDIDDLVASFDALIAKKRDMKQGAMQQLLTGKHRLPGFSGKWAVAPLETLANISKGEQLPASEGIAGGDFPHYNGGIDPSNYTSKTNAPANTIAISEGGNSCGYVNYIRRPFWCGGHCYKIKPKNLNREFLYFALKFGQSDIMALRVGSGLPNIQKGALSSFSITFPESSNEQAAISTALTDITEELETITATAKKWMSVREGMMQQLLTGRIRLA